MIKRPYVILEGFKDKYPITAIFWSNQTDSIMAVNIYLTETLFLYVNEDNAVNDSKGNLKGKIYYD